MSVVKALLAAPAAAFLLAAVPVAQAGPSFSFSIHGGEFFDRGHFHGGHYRHYYGHRPAYRHFGFRYGHPGRHGYRRHGGAWIPAHPYPRRHYRVLPGPRCFYSYGRRYCRW